MRMGKPDAGYRNMRKLTSSEAKLLKCEQKVLKKLMIMTEETGQISFWISNTRTGQTALFTGSIYEYFDANKASAALEQYWTKHGLD